MSDMAPVTVNRKRERSTKGKGAEACTVSLQIGVVVSLLIINIRFSLLTRVLTRLEEEGWKLEVEFMSTMRFNPLWAVGPIRQPRPVVTDKGE